VYEGSVDPRDGDPNPHVGDVDAFTVRELDTRPRPTLTLRQGEPIEIDETPGVAGPSNAVDGACACSNSSSSNSAASSTSSVSYASKMSAPR
jgi:hypothetical protein